VTRGDHRAAAAQALSISLGAPVDPNSRLNGWYFPLASWRVAVAVTESFAPPLPAVLVVAEYECPDRRGRARSDRLGAAASTTKQASAVTR
jgi:hypothetical protein